MVYMTTIAVSIPGLGEARPPAESPVEGGGVANSIAREIENCAVGVSHS